MSRLVVVIGGDSLAGQSGSWAFQSIGVTSVGNDNAAVAQAASSYRKSDGTILMLNLGVAGTHLNTNGFPDLVPLATIYIDTVVAHKAEAPAGLTTRKYLFVNTIGSNDGAIGGLASVSAYATATAAATVARKTAGFDFCAMATLPPRNDGVMTETNRTAYNAFLTDSSWRASNGIDYLIDLAGETTMGNPSTCSNATYYSDGLHPTTAGHALLSPIAASVWTTVLGTF